MGYHMYMNVAINFLMLCAFEFWFQFLEDSWMQPDEVGLYNQWYRSYPFFYSKAYDILILIKKFFFSSMYL